MRSKLLSAQRHPALIFAVIITILIVITLASNGNPVLSTIAASLLLIANVALWAWSALRTTPANNKQIRNLVWSGLALIVAAGGVMLWIQIRPPTVPLLAILVIPWGTMGAGRLIAGGYLFWQARHNGIG